MRTNPETLVENLRRLITDAGLRARLAKDGRRFVASRHDPQEVAKTVLADVAAPHGAVAGYHNPCKRRRSGLVRSRLGRLPRLDSS